MENRRTLFITIGLIILFIIVLSIVVPIVCVGGYRLMGVPYIMSNNKELNEYAQNVLDYPLPPNTELIETSQEVTKLGNGNHCDFVVEVVLETSLSESEIIEYYSSVEFPPARSEYQGYDGEVGERGWPEPVSPWVDYEQNLSGKAIFTLTVADVGYAPGFDYRCN